ncbi:hypothetical protein DV735_g2130, partial [Chaetothyriales sp. CBS 134920]
MALPLHDAPAHSSSAEISVVPLPANAIDAAVSSSTNLTTSVLGAKVLAVSDEYFAAAENLLTPTPPVRKPGVFVHTGAWYDGWETRRHNQKPFDWVVIKLGCVGSIEAVEVDTAHFNGNEAPAAGLDGCFLTEEQEKDSGVEKEDFKGWEEVLPPQPSAERPLEDLAAALNGGVATAGSDQHFGVKSNLLLPGRGKDMGDGWETARSRTKGHTDWVIVRLGLKGRSIEKVVVDTKDFRGNFPRAVRVEAWALPLAKAALGTEDEPKHDSPGWTDLIAGDQPCVADNEHVFEGSALAASNPPQDQVWTHVKMTIIPDGGVKRLRVFGRRA